MAQGELVMEELRENNREMKIMND